MIGIPLSMTLDEPVSDAISFRLTTSFGKDGSEVLCIILMMPEVDVKVGAESVKSDDQHKTHFFKHAYYMLAAEVSWYFAISSIKLNFDVNLSLLLSVRWIRRKT